jgi:hypothetical protein
MHGPPRMPRATAGPSFWVMIANTQRHELREDLDALLGRLARIDEQRVVLAATAEDLGGTGAAGALARLLDALECNLMLTAREADRIQAQAVAGGFR